jgi:hypothetical protein
LRSDLLVDAEQRLADGRLAAPSLLPPELRERVEEFRRCYGNSDADCLLSLAERPITSEDRAKWAGMFRRTQVDSLRVLGFIDYEDVRPRCAFVLFSARPAQIDDVVIDVLPTHWELRGDRWVLVNEFGGVVT